MDRCHALESGTLADRRIGIVLGCNGTDPFSSGAVSALRMFQDASDLAAVEIVGMIYGTASDPGDGERRGLHAESVRFGYRTR